MGVYIRIRADTINASDGIRDKNVGPGRSVSSVSGLLTDWLTG